MNINSKNGIPSRNKGPIKSYIKIVCSQYDRSKDSEITDASESQEVVFKRKGVNTIHVGYESETKSQSLSKVSFHFRDNQSAKYGSNSSFVVIEPTGGADQKPMSKASDGVSVENADEFAAQSCDNGGMDIGFKGSQKEESQVMHWDTEADQPKMTKKSYDEAFGGGHVKSNASSSLDKSEEGSHPSALKSHTTTTIPNDVRDDLERPSLTDEERMQPGSGLNDFEGEEEEEEEEMLDEPGPLDYADEPGPSGAVRSVASAGAPSAKHKSGPSQLGKVESQASVPGEDDDDDGDEKYDGFGAENFPGKSLKKVDSKGQMSSRRSSRVSGRTSPSVGNSVVETAENSVVSSADPVDQGIDPQGRSLRGPSLSEGNMVAPRQSLDDSQQFKESFSTGDIEVELNVSVRITSPDNFVDMPDNRPTHNSADGSATITTGMKSTGTEGDQPGEDDELAFGPEQRTTGSSESAFWKQAGPQSGDKAVSSVSTTSGDAGEPQEDKRMSKVDSQAPGGSNGSMQNYDCVDSDQKRVKTCCPCKESNYDGYNDAEQSRTMQLTEENLPEISKLMQNSSKKHPVHVKCGAPYCECSYHYLKEGKLFCKATGKRGTKKLSTEMQDENDFMPPAY